MYVLNLNDLVSNESYRWNTDDCVAFNGPTNHTLLELMKADNRTPTDSVVEFWE